MRICFPIETDKGLDSTVSDHFGSAALFLVADTDSGATTVISNSDQHHAEGACNPLQALQGSNIEGIAVRNIGAGAVGQLNRSGLRVYKAVGDTVQNNLEKLTANTLPEYAASEGCSGHGNGGGCCH